MSAEYRVQRHPIWSYGSKQRPRAWRCALDNGWHCGHWHPTAEAAVKCVSER